MSNAEQATPRPDGWWDMKAGQWHHLTHTERIQLAIIRNDLVKDPTRGWVDNDEYLLQQYGDQVARLAEAMSGAIQDAVRIELAAMRDAGDLAPTP